MRIASLILFNIFIFSQVLFNSAIAEETPATNVFDIDGNGKTEPLTDGLLALRYQFGFRAEALISRAIGTGATRQTADKIEAYLNENKTVFDIDGNDKTGPLTDGLLLLRYLFGFNGDSLINNAIATNASRSTEVQVIDYMESHNVQSIGTDVIISEVMAVNKTGLVNSDNKRHDWIELHNRGEKTVNISAWCITDKIDEPKQWCFPSGTSLEANSYLIIFASKPKANEITPQGEFHAQLKLKKSGEYLALLKPDGAISDQYDPSFPEQRADVSYGRDSTGSLRYFLTPTPNEANGDGVLDLLEFSVDSLELTGSSSTVISVTTVGGSSQHYTVTSDSDWLNTIKVTGEDGITNDKIEVLTSPQGLDYGTVMGTLTAISPDNNASATLAVELTVNKAVDISGSHPWKGLDVKLNGIGMGVDKAGEQLFYALGAGYSPAVSYTARVNYNSADGYKIGVNNEGPIISGTLYDFNEVTYGTEMSMQIYKNDEKISDYQLVFTSTPVIEITAPTIMDEPKKPATFRLMSKEHETDISEYIGIEFRGRTSQSYPKKAYGITFAKDTYPSDSKKLSLLSMRKDDDWIMDASYGDTIYVRNLVAMDIARAVQPYAYVNDAGKEKGESSIHGVVTEVIQNGQYQGVYLLNEKLDRKQLALEKITVPENANGDKQWSQVDFNDPDNGSVLYKAQWGSATFYYNSSESSSKKPSIQFEQKYPKPEDIERWQPLNALADFVVNSSDQAFINGIDDLVDINSVVNFWLITNVTQTTDTLKTNYYIGRSGAGKFKFFVWDFDSSFGIYYNGNKNSNRDYWHPDRNNLIKRLSELTDTGFNKKVKARWNALKGSTFSKQEIYQRFVDYSAITQPGGSSDTPKSRNMIRWPDSGGDGKGLPELGTLDYINQFLDDRLQWLDSKILSLPE